MVGRYESHQNEANVYCEPQKGIVNIAAEPGNSTENNHYAHMSDIWLQESKDLWYICVLCKRKRS